MQQIALITGVLGGIGSATAKLFRQQGWFVIGIDCQEDQQLAEINHYIQVDLAISEQISYAIEQISQTYQRLDTLINNAAWQICQSAIATTLEEWDKIMAINVRAAFLLSQKTYPLLQKSQGNIVNISSVHAVATSKNIAAYATSKGALVALTRALAIEWASEQIRVNAILPGAVDTPMLHSGLTRGHLSGENLEEMIDQLGQKTVIGRVSQPQEIAQAILFLADNQQSSFITGQTLIIDGGATARLSTE